MTMTILYIMRYWPVCGGGETVTVKLANELVKRGHNVHILYAYRNEISPMPYELDRRIKEAHLNTVDFTESNVNAMGNYLKEHQIDIMVNQWGDQRLCHAAKQLSGTKLIICCHMCFPQEQMPKTFKQKLYKIVAGNQKYKEWRTAIQMKMHKENCQMADYYVFLSKSYEQHFLSLLGTQDNAMKVSSIPNPLTYSYNFDIIRYSDKKKNVLFVGRMLESHKRLSYILKIWKLIEDDPQLSEWNLKMVGDGQSLKTTQKLCSDLELQRVSFEGYKAPRPYYEQSSVFMMTSAFEGFPMTLVESQQNAVVPVVMDSFSALYDVITNGENGIIVEDNDINGFACAMKKLMMDDCYRKKLAERGLETCQKFNVCNIVDEWESLFDEISGD